MSENIALPAAKVLCHTEITETTEISPAAPHSSFFIVNCELFTTDPGLLLNCDTLGRLKICCSLLRFRLRG